MDTDVEEVKLMIQDCIKRKSKMNEYERDFIHSLEGRETWTKKQLEKLDIIWDRVTTN